MVYLEVYFYNIFIIYLVIVIFYCLKDISWLMVGNIDWLGIIFIKYFDLLNCVW